MSDHRILRFAMKLEVKDLLPVRIPRNTKWDVFRETLELNISRVRQVGSDATPLGLESRLAATNQFIIDAYQGISHYRQQPNNKVVLEGPVNSRCSENRFAGFSTEPKELATEINIGST